MGCNVQYQCIVISLKDQFYCHADALIGVYKNRVQRTSSTLSLNLKESVLENNSQDENNSNYSLKLNDETSSSVDGRKNNSTIQNKDDDDDCDSRSVSTHGLRIGSL